MPGTGNKQDKNNRKEQTALTVKGPKHAPKSRRGKTKKKMPAIIKLRIFVVIVLITILGISALSIASYINGISRTHLSGEGLHHAKRYSNCAVVHGIDVSAYQEGKINWRKVKSSEADFVFIRAGYRKSADGELMEDTTFREKIKDAEKTDIMVGAYFFSQAVNESEAVEEADFLLDLVRRYDIDMPLAIDYEFVSDGRLQKAVRDGELFAASQFNDIVSAFCERVEQAGYESAVYGNYDMLTNNMDATLIDDDVTIWAAQYGGSCDVEADYMFWQCSESDEVDGIEGFIDHDIWYIEPGKVYPTRAAGISDAVSVGECKVELDAESYSLKNHRAVPKVTVTYDGKKLKKGKHYSLSFVCNETEGTGYAIIRGVKTYRDWIAVPFTIE